MSQSPQLYAIQVTDGMVKFRRRNEFFKTRDEFRSYRLDLVEIDAARNEHEPFQVVVFAAEQDLANVTVETGVFMGKKGEQLGPSAIKAHLVYYIYVPPCDAWYPDALLPFRPFDLPKGETQSVWFDIKIDEDVEPDVYEGTVTVHPSGLEPQTVAVRLTVHTFALPNVAPTRTAFGFEAGRLAGLCNVEPGTPEFEALHDEYYWFLVDHHLSPQSLPVPLDPVRMRRYLDDPRVTGVRIPYSDDPAVLERTIRLFRDHGWLSKGYFYPVDEPYHREDYDRLKAAAAKIHAIEPQAKVICPYYKNPAFDPDTTAIQHLIGAVDLWCPLTSYFHEEALAARKATGDEVWWYTCCIPIEPYPNFQIQMPPLDHRILFWLQKYYNVDGFLYWSVNSWGANPYKDLPTVWLDSRQHDTYSDGVLLYPGEHGPVSSIRLELIREGLEDFQYFNLLEERVGREEMEHFLRQAVGGHTFYERDPERLMGVRARIARRIEDVTSEQ